MIGQQFQQVWSLDDNIHPLQDEPYKSTFFFFNTPDHEELNAEDASTGSVSHRVSCAFGKIFGDLQKFRL